MARTKKQYGWRCGYEKVYGSFHGDNERCTCSSSKMYESMNDAVTAALRHTHRHSVYVYSSKRGYIGLAEGLNFNK